ncbi:MAG: hypothetical protein KJZ69_16015, partial [Phycisphaerales bacterium]|nr:hypothetical protein [Phycisphaerales bacterium]
MRANTVNAGWPSTDDAKHWDAWEANVIIDGPTGEDVVHFGYAMACKRYRQELCIVDDQAATLGC